MVGVWVEFCHGKLKTRTLSFDFAGFFLSPSGTWLSHSCWIPVHLGIFSTESSAAQTIQKVHIINNIKLDWVCLLNSWLFKVILDENTPFFLNKPMNSFGLSTKYVGRWFRALILNLWVAIPLGIAYPLSLYSFIILNKKGHCGREKGIRVDKDQYTQYTGNCEKKFKNKILRWSMDKHEDLPTTAHTSQKCISWTQMPNKSLFLWYAEGRVKWEMTMIRIWLHTIKWECKSVFQQP